MFPNSPSRAHLGSSPRKNKFSTPANNAHSSTSQESPIIVVQGDMKFIYDELKKGQDERLELTSSNDELKTQLLDMYSRIKEVLLMSLTFYFSSTSSTCRCSSKFFSSQIFSSKLFSSKLYSSKLLSRKIYSSKLFSSKLCSSSKLFSSPLSRKLLVSSSLDVISP